MDITSQKIHAGKQTTDYSFSLTLRELPKPPFQEITRQGTVTHCTSIHEKELSPRPGLRRENKTKQVSSSKPLQAIKK